jgi:hypothetical protein
MILFGLVDSRISALAWRESPGGRRFSRCGLPGFSRAVIGFVTLPCRDSLLTPILANALILAATSAQSARACCRCRLRAGSIGAILVFSCSTIS